MKIIPPVFEKNGNKIKFKSCFNTFISNNKINLVRNEKKELKDVLIYI